MTDPLAAVHSACVSRVPIFAGLPPAEQDIVAGYVRHIDLAPGERLYGPGDQLSRLFVVHAGRVRVVRITAPGREQLIRVAGPGELVGEYPFLTGRPPVAWVFADEPSRLCVFDHTDLTQLLSTYPSIAVRLLQSLARRLSDAERRLTDLAGSDVPTRVADYLLALPPERRNGRVGVRLPMSKRDVASYLGTSPESLSRGLHRLQVDGLIEVGSHGWIALRDRSGLESLTSGPASHDPA